MRNNITVAAFGAELYTQTSPLWQWDQGQILRITGLALPSAFVAEFSNTAERGSAVVQVGTDGDVSIPDTLLETGCPVFCWIVLSSGEEDRETVVSIRMPVLQRAQPTGETPTPAQQSAIDQAIAALNAAVTGVQSMTAEAETLPAGSPASASWNPDTNTLTLGIPEGEPGADGAPGQDGTDGAPGENGFSPTVSIVDIPGGHRLTITDVYGDHSFDVMDGQGGGGGTPYDSDPEALGVADPGVSDAYARGDHVHPMPSASDVGAYELPSGGIPLTDLAAGVQTSLGKADSAYQKPSGGIPKSDLASGVQTSLEKADSALQSAPVTSVNSKTGAVSLEAADVGALPDDTVIPSAATATPADLGTAAVGSSSKYAKEDHVHNKPTYSKSDVGLGNVDNVQQYSATNPPPYPVTSVNGQVGAVSLSIPSTAGDVGAVAVAQGVGHAGEFLVVGSDGNVTTVTLATWQGGSY